MRYSRIILLSISCLLISARGLANGLCVSDVQLNRSDTKVIVSFDLTWNNSWNNKQNSSHDGAWIFAKYRTDDGDWKPVYFDRSGHTAAEKTLGKAQTGFEPGYSGVDTVAEVLGVFIYPKTSGNFKGAVNFENTELMFDSKKHGIFEEHTLSVRVFGIEMCYIPEGEFDLGDNGNPNRFLKHDSVLYLANAHSFNFYEGTAGSGIQGSRNSLFPLTNSNDAIMGYYAPGIGTVDANNMDGLENLRGPWIPFGMLSKGNGIADSEYWLTLYGTADWQWIEFQFEPGVLKQGLYAVIKSKLGDVFTPRGFYIAGSNDGVEYKLLAGYPNHTKISDLFGVAGSMNNGVYMPFRINAPGVYNRYRFYFYSGAVAIPFIGLYDDDESVNAIADESPLYYLNRSTVIPSEFPKGYQSFWAMKYELTQSAWVDFLNTLTFDQQRTRTGVAPNAAVNTRLFSSGRNYIRIRSVDKKVGRATYGLSVDPATTGWDPANNACDIPMTNMSWADGIAYADWAGLRPLTELEYEKMCRGTIQAIPNEYAWGSSMLYPIDPELGLDNLNKVNEVQSRDNKVSIGNCRVSPNGTVNNTYWPMRVGAFATDVHSRLESGGTFYGMFNVNDNVAERYVNVSTPQGRSFNGLHGDGRLNGSGLSNVSNWPGADAKGTGYRGFYNNNVVPVSDRRYAEVASSARSGWDGFRCGRTSWGDDGVVCPTIGISQVNGVGGEVTLVASKGLSYRWNTGEQTPQIEVNPIETTKYTVTATTIGGCTKTASVTIIR